MSETTMGDVYDASKQLIRALGQAHLKWVLVNRTEDGVKARVSAYVAFRALSRVFDLAGVLEDAEAIHQLDALADGIQVMTQEVADEMDTKGNA